MFCLTLTFCSESSHESSDGGCGGGGGGKGVENRDICARVASWNMANNCGIFIRSRMMSREYNAQSIHFKP